MSVPTLVSLLPFLPIGGLETRSWLKLEANDCYHAASRDKHNLMITSYLKFSLEVEKNTSIVSECVFVCMYRSYVWPWCFL